MPLTNSSGPAESVRGHNYRLISEKKKIALRDNFFTNRITKHWNKLEAESIEAETINSFKNSIDKSA